MTVGSKILRSIVFYPMLWLRGLMLLVGKVLGGLFLIVGVVGFVAKFPMGLSILMIVLSIVTFVISFTYDLILLKLNPTGQTLVLTR